MDFIKTALYRFRKNTLNRAWDTASAHTWPAGAGIRAYLDAGPARARTLAGAPLLALDFETDGLNAKTDPILSAGFVAVQDSVVLGQTAEHIVAQSGSRLSKRAVAVHGLTDTDVKAGVSLEALLDRLFHALAGRIILAHHAIIEVSFLRQACFSLYGASPPLMALDTLKIEQRRPGQRADTLRLLDLRKAYGLPPYQNHHALSDAHACAELYLAQLAKAGGDTMPLSAHVAVSL